MGLLVWYAAGITVCGLLIWAGLWVLRVIAEGSED
jgi:hypothetical protein